MRQAPGLATIRHAVENASVDAITDAGILAILRGEGGSPAHLHAVFGDVSLRALEGAGAAAGISLAVILRSYRAARVSAGAANPELDAMLAEPW